METLDFTRRRLVLSATTAGLAFGLGGPLEIIGSAAAQQGVKPSPMNPKGIPLHRFKVGDIEVTQIFDGAAERDHNPGFIKNATVDDAKAALKTAGLPDAKMPNTYTVTVAKIGGRYVMFDSGNGFAARPNSGLLEDGLKAAGIELAKVTTVIITHFHPDHISGLVAKDGGQVFGHAEIIVPEAEYKFWTDPLVTSNLPEARKTLAKRIQLTFPSWKNIRQIKSEGDVVAGVKAMPTFGHSPGHTSFVLGSGNDQLIVLGDVTNIPAINMRNPGWHIAFDQDPQQAEKTRRATFDKVVADKIVCTGFHWGMPGAGTVTKDGKGYVLTPVA